MSERSEAMKPHAVRDAASAYRAVPVEITPDEVPPGYKRTDVGVIPEDWEVKLLGELYEIKSSKRVLQRDWKKYGVPFFRTREIAVLAEKGKVENELFISEELYEEYSKKYGVPRIGDVLITGIGTIGKVYVIQDDRRFYFKDASVLWLKSRGLFDSVFLKNLFETPLLEAQLGNSSTGTTVETYTISGAKSTVVVAPKLKEQRAIATSLSDADALIESLDRLIAKKRAIKQAAMQQLLTGQTRLPGFEGEWETKWLGDVARIGTGDRNNQDKTPQGKYPFFVRSESIERIDSYWFDCEAILVPGEGRIGNIFHYINGKFDVHQRVYAIREFDNSVDARFVYFYMVHQFGAWAFRNTVKATVDSLRLPTFKKFPMEMPVSVIEQAAISGVLSDMDREIESLERRRDKARQIKQGMMQKLLTGRVRLA